jgi:hypothetical protein
LKRALLVDPLAVEPVLVGGETVKVDDFLADWSNIDYRAVPVMQSRTMRARPIVRDWSTTHTLDLLDDVVDVHVLDPIIERAGRLVGLCDWHPIYGTFTTALEVGP